MTSKLASALTTAVLAAILATSGLAMGDVTSPIMIGYSQADSTQPRYRSWQAGAWTAEEAVPNTQVDDLPWVILRNCPTRNEWALGTINWWSEATLTFYDGSAWSDDTKLCSDIGVNDQRPFDLAYEGLSGDLLVAYWIDSGANRQRIGYRTYGDGALASQRLLTLPESFRIMWIALYPLPHSDRMLLLALSTTLDLYAVFWDGSDFSTVATLHDNLQTASSQCFDAAFESLSGEGLVIYCSNGHHYPKHRRWNGITWSAEMELPSVGATQRWFRLVPDPVSDSILMGCLDNAKDINVSRWNGDSWSAVQELETNACFSEVRTFDIAFEPQGTRALIAYPDNWNDTLRYRVWNGSSWAGEVWGPNLSDDPTVTGLATGLATGEIFACCQVDGLNLKFMRWNGTALSASADLATAVESWGAQGFMVSVPAPRPLVPAGVPYSNDFQSSLGPEWSDSTATDNATLTRFAGRHRIYPLKLALNTTAGETYRVVFDLYCLDSWDGTTASDGSAPDYFIVSANTGGNEAFRCTFNHEWPDSQGATYPYPYDAKGHYGFNGSWKDAVYRRVEATFTATYSVTVLSFVGHLTDESGQGFNDESWGIDNISVAAARFVDGSTSRGVELQTSNNAATYGSGLASADLNQDGWPDVIVTGNASSRLLVNIPGESGRGFSAGTLGGGVICRQGALLDADNDGSVDFWGVSSTQGQRLWLNNGAAAYADVGPIGLTSPTGGKGLAAADVNGDGFSDIVMFSGNGNWLGLNRGENPAALTQSQAASYGLNGAGDCGVGDYCSSGDVNNDGFPDFFYHYNSGRLFLSLGDGTYTSNSGGISVTTSPNAPIGSAWGDYDNDGDLDLYCTRLAEGCSGYLWRNNTLPPGSSPPLFTNVTSLAGFSLNTVINYTPDNPGTRSVAWGDCDNDGYLDLFLAGANGANYLYRNQGNGTFARVGEGVVASGKFIDVAFIDYDNDGDLDLLLTRENSTMLLFENRTNNLNYLKVRVLGRGAGGTNRAGVGVRVELWDAAGQARLARRDVGTARGYGGTEPLWAHFGGVNPVATYTVKAYLASRSVDDPYCVQVVPAATSTTIGSTTISQMVTVEEPAGVRILHWREVPRTPSDG